MSPRYSLFSSITIAHSQMVPNIRTQIVLCNINHLFALPGQSGNGSNGNGRVLHIRHQIVEIPEKEYFVISLKLGSQLISDNDRKQ